MRTDTSIVSFPHPDTLDDPLTSVLREGARRLLTQAVEAEAEAFLAAMADERLADVNGHRSFRKSGRLKIPCFAAVSRIG